MFIVSTPGVGGGGVFRVSAPCVGEGARLELVHLAWGKGRV